MTLVCPRVHVSYFTHSHKLGKGSRSPSPTAGQVFSLAKDGDEEDSQRQTNAQNSTLQEQQISAADYDPSQDRREEEQRRFAAVKSDPDVIDVQELEEEIELEESDDDVDDMFAVVTEDKPKKVKKMKKVAVRTPSLQGKIQC